jgi:Peptidase A4 family
MILVTLWHSYYGIKTHRDEGSFAEFVALCPVEGSQPAWVTIGGTWASQTSPFNDQPFPRIVAAIFPDGFALDFHSLVKMSHFIRTCLITLAVAWGVAAELSFVATAQWGDQVVDISDLEFVPIPPRQHANHGTTLDANVTSTEKRETIGYSGNWCGASQHSTPSDQIVNVFGYFTAPELTLRPDTPAPQYAAAWVGMDGASCPQTLLQAGVTTVVGVNSRRALGGGSG